MSLPKEEIYLLIIGTLTVVFAYVLMAVLL
jgi:hypothetical protein